MTPAPGLVIPTCLNNSYIVKKNNEISNNTNATVCLPSLHTRLSHSERCVFHYGNIISIWCEACSISSLHRHCVLVFLPGEEFCWADIQVHTVTHIHTRSANSLLTAGNMKLYSCTCGLNEWVSAPCQGHLNVLSIYLQLVQRFKGGDFLAAQVEPLLLFFFCFINFFYCVHLKGAPKLQAASSK